MDGPEYNLLNRLLGKYLGPDRPEGNTGKRSVRVPSPQENQDTGPGKARVGGIIKQTA